MSLREDNGPYCLVWLGMLLMGAYYTSFAYLIWTDSGAAASFFAPANFIFMIGLMILPPVMAFFFTGYLRPTRGKAKMTMLGPSVFLGLIYVILAATVLASSDIITNLVVPAAWERDPSEYTHLGNLLVFSAWGIGSAILTAGGFSIAQSYEQSSSPGILDVSSLHYGPPEAEEEEPEPEAIAESTAEETVAAASTETTEESSEPEAASEESEPVSE